MHFCTMFSVLLILQCWVSMLSAESLQISDISSYISVGNVNFNGSSLRIYEIDGVQVSEPRVSFGDLCGNLRYNHMYEKYQVTLPLEVDINVLTTPTDKSKKIGQLILTKLRVEANKALTSRDSDLFVMAELTRAGDAQLIFLCSTFTRCQRLLDHVTQNPEQIQRAVQFVAMGRVGSNPVKFGATPSANVPKFKCPASAGQWVVFQKRVDGSLSFAQNWDTYVKGFGNPDSNYWMGLDNLFVMTVTTTGVETSRCELRIETEDLKGNKYWAQFKQFQVLGPEHNYRLGVGAPVAESQFSMDHHNNRAFSTYDRDNDAYSGGSCSQEHGYGGFWYGACHYVNFNGAYTTDKTIDSAIYDTIRVGEKRVPMKSTLMKFKCNT